MDKAAVIAGAIMAAKSMGLGLYMEIERRMGKTRYGSVLGFLGAKLAGPVMLAFLRLSSMFKKSPDKQPPQEGKEK